MSSLSAAAAAVKSSGGGATKVTGSKDVGSCSVRAAACRACLLIQGPCRDKAHMRAAQPSWGAMCVCVA